MRNFLLIVLIAAAGYWFANHHRGHDHAGELAGAWTQEFLRESTPCTMTLSLDGDGNASLRLNYVQSGQRMVRDVSGQWQCAQGRFAFTFTPGAAPPFVEAKRFAGRIITLDNRLLQFRSPTGVESWSRVH